MTAIFSLTAAGEAAAALEAGKVLMLPDGGDFRLAPEEEHLRDPKLLGGAKNISLSPDGELKNTSASNDDQHLLAVMMGRFADFAMDLVKSIAPNYSEHLTPGRTSFRPAEIAGRKSSPLKDDSRLHVDAFPTTPMAGRRILRVFANVNATEPRLWNVGEPFEAVAKRFLPKIKPRPESWHSLLAALHVTKTRRTAYDDLMLGLHNRAKLDMNYQETCEKERLVIPAGAVWLCYTDQVMHAALSGQHALEQTFYLPPDAMADPSTTPLRVLERLSGRNLL